jgi:hypothetical protein
MTDRARVAQLERRVKQLEARLAARGAWSARARRLPTQQEPEPVLHAEVLLTSKQYAERLGINVKTLLRRRLNGELAQEPLVLGKRGRAALRWRGTEVEG